MRETLKWPYISRTLVREIMLDLNASPSIPQRRQFSGRDGGVTRMPACRPLIGMSHAAQHRFAEPSPGELNTVGQTIRREAARQADVRRACKIHRHGELSAARLCRRPGSVISRQRTDLNSSCSSTR
jgi:hypothetical protein